MNLVDQKGHEKPVKEAYERYVTEVSPRIARWHFDQGQVPRTLGVKFKISACSLRLLSGVSSGPLSESVLARADGHRET